MKTVIFDLDGVLARFTDGIYTAHGRPVEQPKVWNFHHDWGMKDEDLYAKCDRDFWANLPVWEDGVELVKRAESIVGTDRIAFLTAPVRTPGCEEGKRAWFAKHFPQYDPWADLFIGGRKHKLAFGGAVLVDDSDDNCEKWKKAGGRALLIPRPWNARSHSCDENGLFHVGYEQQHLEALLK